MMASIKDMRIFNKSEEVNAEPEKRSLSELSSRSSISRNLYNNLEKGFDLDTHRKLSAENMDMYKRGSELSLHKVKRT